MREDSERDYKPVPARIIAQYTLAVLAVLATALFVWQINQALLAAFGGIIIAVVITGFARQLRRFLPLSRTWSLISVALLVVTFITLFIVFLGPQINREFDQLTDRLPRQLMNLQETLRGLTMGEQVFGTSTIDFEEELNGDTDETDGPDVEPPLAPGSIPETSGASEASGSSGSTDAEDEDSSEESADSNGSTDAEDEDSNEESADSSEGEEESTMDSQEIQQVGGFIFKAGATVVNVLSNLVVVLFTGIFFAANPTLYKNGVLLLVAKKREKRVGEALDAAGAALWKWLTAQLIAMAFVGISVSIGLIIIDLPLALVLGLIAGLLDFVPYIGPFAAFFPALLIAFAEGPEMILMTAAVYLIVQQLEGNLVTPLVQQQRVSIPPAMVILSIVAFGLVFGVAGVIMATPLAVVAMVLVGMLYVQDVLKKEVTIPGQDL